MRQGHCNIWITTFLQPNPYSICGWDHALHRTHLLHCHQSPAPRRSSIKDMSERDRKKAGQSFHKATYQNASENQKFSRVPLGQWPLALFFFYVPKSDLKSRFRYKWITGYEPEPEREFSEVTGRVQQNSGTLISSLFCRRKKIPDGFPLWILGFFSLISKSSGVSMTPSFMVCHHWESSS